MGICYDRRLVKLLLSWNIKAAPKGDSGTRQEGDLTATSFLSAWATYLPMNMCLFGPLYFRICSLQ